MPHRPALLVVAAVTSAASAHGRSALRPLGAARELPAAGDGCPAAAAPVRQLDVRAATAVGPKVPGGPMALLGGRCALITSTGGVRHETALPRPLRGLRARRLSCFSNRISSADSKASVL